MFTSIIYAINWKKHILKYHYCDYHYYYHCFKNTTTTTTTTTNNNNNNNNNSNNNNDLHLFEILSFPRRQN